MDIITVKCIDRIHNRENVITEYVLEDEHGETKQVKACQLRVALKMNSIIVSNMLLTKNNRLVMKKVPDNQKET